VAERLVVRAEQVEPAWAALVGLALWVQVLSGVQGQALFP